MPMHPCMTPAIPGTCRSLLLQVVGICALHRHLAGEEHCMGITQAAVFSMPEHAFKVVLYMCCVEGVMQCLALSWLFNWPLPCNLQPSVQVYYTYTDMKLHMACQQQCYVLGMAGSTAAVRR